MRCRATTVRHVAQRNRRAVGRDERHVFQVADDALRVEPGVGCPRPCAEPADAAGDELGVPLVDDVAADGRVRPADRLRDLTRCDQPCVREADRVEFDLVFQRQPADAGDFGHARHGRELRADVPVLNRPQPAGVEPVAFDGVPEDLAGRGRVGGEPRSSSGGPLPGRAGQRSPTCRRARPLRRDPRRSR